MREFGKRNFEFPFDKQSEQIRSCAKMWASCEGEGLLIQKGLLTQFCSPLSSNCTVQKWVVVATRACSHRWQYTVLNCRLTEVYCSWTLWMGSWKCAVWILLTELTRFYFCSSCTVADSDHYLLIIFSSKLWKIGQRRSLQDEWKILEPGRSMESADVIIEWASEIERSDEVAAAKLKKKNWHLQILKNF
jgi:hypothetical protein